MTYAEVREALQRFFQTDNLPYDIQAALRRLEGRDDHFPHGVSLSLGFNLSGGQPVVIELVVRPSV